MLIGGERPGAGPIEVESADTDLTDRDREPEHRPLQPPRRSGRTSAHLTTAGLAKSGSSNRCVLTVRVHAWPLTQRVLQLLDLGADLVGGHTEPRGRSPASNMIPAPDISVISAHTAHNRVVAPEPSSAASRVRIRSNRSAGTTHRRPAETLRSGRVLRHRGDLSLRGGAHRGTRTMRIPEKPSVCRSANRPQHSRGGSVVRSRRRRGCRSVTGNVSPA